MSREKLEKALEHLINEDKEQAEESNGKGQGATREEHRTGARELFASTRHVRPTEVIEARAPHDFWCQRAA